MRYLVCSVIITRAARPLPFLTLSLPCRLPGVWRQIYGHPLESPQSETYWGNVNPLGPRSQPGSLDFTGTLGFTGTCHKDTKPVTKGQAHTARALVRVFGACIHDEAQPGDGVVVAEDLTDVKLLTVTA